MSLVHFAVKPDEPESLKIRPDNKSGIKYIRQRRKSTAHLPLLKTHIDRPYMLRSAGLPNAANMAQPSAFKTSAPYIFCI